jgi:hypothetical protein
VEAAAMALESQLAALKGVSNWRLNTRQYAGNAEMEENHVAWALRQALPADPAAPNSISISRCVVIG